MISLASKRILHVFGRMVQGGAEMRTLDLMRNVDRRQYRLDFCALSGRRGPLDRQVVELGGKVYACRLGLLFPYRFRSLLRGHGFDVVHSHLHHFSGYVLRLAAQCGVPVRVAHFRSSEDGHADTLRRRLQRRLMRRWTDRYATNILAVSEAAMRAAWRPDWQDDPRCEVIYNGLSPTAFQAAANRDGVRSEFGFSPGCLLAIHVGRLVVEKNHPRLLSIFRELLRHRPDARLLLVGWDDRGGFQRVRREVQRLRLEGQVVMAGARSDVPRLLKASDVLVFPSLWEGLPGAVLEACAAGTPVIASDLPAIREIAGHFPSVRCVSLAECDSCWAQAVVAAANVARSEVFRYVIQQAFAGSRFAIDRCAQEMCRIWQGPSESDPSLCPAPTPEASLTSLAPAATPGSTT